MTALLEILTSIVVGLSAAVFSQFGGGVDGIQLSRPKAEQVRSVRRSPAAEPVAPRAHAADESAQR